MSSNLSIECSQRSANNQITFFIFGNLSDINFQNFKFIINENHTLVGEFSELLQIGWNNSLNIQDSIFTDSYKTVKNNTSFVKGESYNIISLKNCSSQIRLLQLQEIIASTAVRQVTSSSTLISCCLLASLN